MADQLSKDPEAVVVEGAGQKPPTEATLTNETESKSPEELEPTVQNIPDRAEKSLTDQPADSQEAMIIEKVDQGLLPELTLPTETRLESPEKPEPTAHNNPDRADTFLSDHLSEHPEETSVEKPGQKSSIEGTLTNETKLESPEKPEPADQADQGIKKVGQKTSTELTLTDETKLKSP